MSQSDTWIIVSGDEAKSSNTTISVYHANLICEARNIICEGIISTDKESGAVTIDPIFRPCRIESEHRNHFIGNREVVVDTIEVNSELYEKVYALLLQEEKENGCSITYNPNDDPFIEYEGEVDLSKKETILH